MASRLLRRSGVAVGLVCEVLEFIPNRIYQVGIGHYHQETEVLSQEWPGVEWFGCEPHPHIAAQLIGPPRTYPGVVHQVAVSDYDGWATLYAPKRFAEGASLHQLSGNRVEEHGVRVVTLDNLFRPCYGKNLLWLDCEGSELGVLRGGPEFLSKIQVINVEITGRPASSGQWSNPSEVHQHLVDAGFYRQWIHTGRITAGQYDAVYVRHFLFRPEYSCDPWEISRWEANKR